MSVCELSLYSSEKDSSILSSMDEKWDYVFGIKYSFESLNNLFVIIEQKTQVTHLQHIWFYPTPHFFILIITKVTLRAFVFLLTMVPTLMLSQTVDGHRHILRQNLER